MMSSSATSWETEFAARPLCDECNGAFERREHVMIGISPFNSYFSESRICALVCWAQQTFDEMHLFVPDDWSVYTLRALGYSEARAIKKAARQASYLHNKIRRALGKVGFDGDRATDLVLTAESVAQLSTYRKRFNEYLTLYDADGEFREACRSGSKWVLSEMTGEHLSAQSLDLAAQYLLAEMPLMLDTPGVLKQKSSVFGYHKYTDFIEGLYRGRFPLYRSPRQGFVVIV